jgi:hypothetical protein
VDRIELAWAAGFFDGEGWANAVAHDGRKTKQPQARINQADPNGVPYVLERFRRVVGVGRIGGPVVQEGKEDLYHWIASSRADVLAVFRLIAPWLGEVKRKEFEDALRLAGPPSEWGTAPLPEKAAWAAGLFDGEGWTSLSEYSSRDGYYSIEMGITQSGSEERPEVVRRFADLSGRGHFYGPFHAPRRRPIHRWKTFGPDNVEAVLHLVLPQLGPVKRDQALSALRIVRAQRPLTRGNPAWGAYTERCVNGHEYASARIRPYRPRKEGGKQQRASKQCLECSREQARARRERRKREG